VPHERPPAHPQQILQYRKECRGQTLMAALWRAYRTKHYGPHAKALRLRRVRAGQPEDPPPHGSNRMIQRDAQVLKRWADKKAALARRAQLPTHETLLQQHARKRGWSQQRSDNKPCCSVHWSTRATLRTVQSHDSARANALRSPATGGGGVLVILKANWEGDSLALSRRRFLVVVGLACL